MEGVNVADIHGRLHPEGKKLILRANCDFGFIRWEANDPAALLPDPRLTVTMNKNLDVVAICEEPVPPTVTPSPTATPQPGFKLSINGFVLEPGEETRGVSLGTIVLSRAPDADGTYPRNVELELEVESDYHLAAVNWTGVSSESEDGTVVTVTMSGPRNIDVRLISVGPKPTPVP